jgi:hypothetical protein
VSDTTAVQLDLLAKVNHDSGSGQPLCPACKNGRLHPYLVEISLSQGVGDRWHGADYLTGWVAVCVGNGMHNRKMAEFYAQLDEDPPLDPEVPPCGFSMPMTPHRREFP